MPAPRASRASRPSQFNREYSRLFGAPPGRDVARLPTVAPSARSAA